VNLQTSDGADVWRDRAFHLVGDVSPDGERLGAGFFDTLPTKDYRIAFGIQLSYSPEAADKSVLVEGWEHEGHIYIIDVVNVPGGLERFAKVLREKSEVRPRAKARWYASTTELGLGRLLRRWCRGLKCLSANGDRAGRALRTSMAWNAGKLLLPDPAYFEAPWRESFMRAVTFDGPERDALVAMHDELVPGSMVLGGPRPVKRAGWFRRIVNAMRAWWSD
jgi:hypothetical protein